ncbi:recombination factor protein RarA [Companilactobacillus paralimentarius DSM 13238 = JCM 10415]|uniref:Recombination factor protein RarA n=1 Tax=Companilactobacillus paralimentarius DSM 13238 = JCM 10415 TaxID=1122151 RepID=A0A0R1PHR6_9LACO|nr:replication-associated recombination protein A [Companilactobacillus paralimentarius]KAE9564161.1 AAA family ATPase [Companilactobacillus paralimentarius]KRL31663.1 recombination factor protein RarA [Companilactobacillus paralimentarius DSM 13238 = JCM 10415]MDR4933682.1 replication-associated recombination protein A [Companilactobacillus paralimentarius]QFR70144.1 AAA family ATPase [Companilactobacillus paralimentarius]
MSFKTPLADLMRPQTLDQMVGQQELLKTGQPLRQIIDQHVNIPLLLWGPPGTGKTTLAKIIAKANNYPFDSFNASTDNKAKLTKQIDQYPDDSFVLLIDEIHRMTKTLQDFLLPYLENGHIMLIGSTTENPIMSIVPAIRSRSQIFEFKSLSDTDIETMLKRAVTEIYKLTDEQVETDSLKLIAISADGDLRIALNTLETIHAINPDKITVENVKKFAQQQHFNYDKKATKHYDYLSAYSDSMAGSDTDAALYYLAVLLKNNDLPSVVRRLREIPYTYIGLANPQQVTQIVVAANQAEKIGMPKAKYPLMSATMLMCISPKSVSFDETWEKLDQDTEHPNEHPMPKGLRDMHYKHSEEITGGGLIDSPFASPHQLAQQNYMPKGLKGRRYYYPKDNNNEKKLGEQYLKLHRYIYQEDYKDSDSNKGQQ